MSAHGHKLLQTLMVPAKGGLAWQICNGQV